MFKIYINTRILRPQVRLSLVSYHFIDICAADSQVTAEALFAGRAPPPELLFIPVIEVGCVIEIGVN